jgi:hypothetical protein
LVVCNYGGNYDSSGNKNTEVIILVVFLYKKCF